MLPNRVSNVVDSTYIKRVLVTLKNAGKLNLKANETNQYGIVIYPIQNKKHHLHRICGFSGSISLYIKEYELSMNSINLIN